VLLHACSLRAGKNAPAMQPASPDLVTHKSSAPVTCMTLSGTYLHRCLQHHSRPEGSALVFCFGISAIIDEVCRPGPPPCKQHLSRCKPFGDLRASPASPSLPNFCSAQTVTSCCGLPLGWAVNDHQHASGADCRRPTAYFTRLMFHVPGDSHFLAAVFLSVLRF
jgi:hypothetical protein